MNSEWSAIYADRVEVYRQLALAAEENLRRACHTHDLGDQEIADISHRVKTHRSLEEKATRKNYDSPLLATDIVGTRVVYLYKSDAQRVEQAVLSILKGSIETGEIEKVHHGDETDKLDDHGYRADHYVGHLKDAGIQFVDEIPVEIQVRTVGQEAWALLEKGLVYKTMSAVPRHLVRNVLGLSILYELADDRFDLLREKQREYETDLHEVNDIDLLSGDIDLDSINEMLMREYSLDLGVGSEPELSWLLQDLDREQFQTIGDINRALARTLPIARDFLNKRRPLGPPIRQRLELTIGLALADPGLLDFGWPRGIRKEDRDTISSITKPYRRQIK